MANQPDEEPPLDQDGGRSAKERQRLVDYAAKQFARLFLEQVLEDHLSKDKNRTDKGNMPR